MKIQAKIIHPATKFNMRHSLVRDMTLPKTKGNNEWNQGNNNDEEKTALQ